MARVSEDRVLETAAANGTGPLTLAGPVLGFRAFGSVMQDGDTCVYTAEAIDASSARTGAWETGIATYSQAGNALLRTQVVKSSNNVTPIDFGNVTVRAFIDITADAMRRARSVNLAWTKRPLANFGG